MKNGNVRLWKIPSRIKKSEAEDNFETYLMVSSFLGKEKRLRRSDSTHAPGGVALDFWRKTIKL